MGKGKKVVAQSYRFMEYYYRVAVVLNAVPFSYDFLTKRWAHRHGSLKQSLWMVISMGGIHGELLNVTAELIRGFGDEGVGRGEWCLNFFIFLSWFLITKLYWNLYLHGDEIVNHLNQTLKLRELYGEGALPKCSDHKVVRGHISSSMIQCFFQCLMVAAEGGKRQYIYSLVPEERRSGVTQAVWSIYSTWRVMTNFQIGYFFIFTGMIHVQTVTQILDYRKMYHEGPFAKLKSYRMLQILCSRYNEAHSTIFLPSITIFASANIILGNYGTLRFANELPTEVLMNFPLMACMMLILVFTFYPKNASVRERADGENKIAQKAGILSFAMETAEKGWKCSCVSVVSDKGGDALPSRMEKGGHGGERRSQPCKCGFRQRMEKVGVLKEVQVNTRSCAGVSVNMGNFYAIKRTTVLNIFQFIICNTISALLTWK